MKKAFTLAEVLLVIAIIGVVAVFSIPNLNSNINEEKNITLLRSTVDQLNSAVGQVHAEYGFKATQTDCASGLTGPACFGDKVANYLDLRANCKATKNGKCFTTGPLLNIDGSVIRDNASESCAYMFILANGVHVCFDEFSIIDIDVDGPNKGPNQRGVDCFRLAAANDGQIEPFVAPVGSYDSSHTGKPNLDYDEYNEWAYSIGNMDYLRCVDNLNWINKHSCD